MTSVDKVDMTNPRVGVLPNSSTQNALAGVDVALQASVTPSNATGGSYSWTFTGPFSISGGATNSSSVTIRPLDAGTITARVNYSLNGVNVSSTVNINAVLPTLTSFVAQQDDDVVWGPEPFPCSGFANRHKYTLGCGGVLNVGIAISVSAQVPASNYLNDPA